MCCQRVSHDVLPTDAHRLALPCPSAQNASERSSMHMNTCARACCAAASVSGDDLEPAKPTHTVKAALHR